MKLKLILCSLALALAAYGQTAQTRSTLESTYFADGQAAGSITPSRMRDFVRSAVVATAGSGAPSGSCVAGRDIYTDTAASEVYWCPATDTWKKILSGYTVGTSASNLVQLNGSAQLPAVSGALLTNLGNAATATALATARAIGGVNFDGTAAIVPQTVQTVDGTDSTSFVAIFDAATGNQQPKTDAGLTYNAETGVLSATGFSGPLTGNVTGNTSGTATGLAAQYIDWNATSGGNSIANKPSVGTGDVVGTTGSGVPSANCTVGKAVYYDTTNLEWYVCGPTANTWRRVLTSDDTAAGLLTLKELLANGTNYWSLSVPDSLSANRNLALPDTSPTSGQYLTIGTPSGSSYPLAFTTLPNVATAASGGSLTTSGAYAVTLTATNTTNATLPAGTKTLLATDGSAASLTNFPSTLATAADPVFTGSVQLPNGTGPTVDAAGEIAVDTTTDQLQFYGGAKRALPTKQPFSIVIPAVADTDDFVFIKLPWGITLESIDGFVSGATSATFNVQECSSTGTSCADMATADIIADTDGANTTSFSDATAAAGAWLKIDVASISGTPGTLTITIVYRVVAD